MPLSCSVLLREIPTFSHTVIKKIKSCCGRTVMNVNGQKPSVFVPMSASQTTDAFAANASQHHTKKRTISHISYAGFKQRLRCVLTSQMSLPFEEHVQKPPSCLLAPFFFCSLTQLSMAVTQINKNSSKNISWPHGREFFVKVLSRLYWHFMSKFSGNPYLSRNVFFFFFLFGMSS